MKCYKIDFEKRTLEFLDNEYWDSSMGKYDDLYDMTKDLNFKQQFHSFDVPNLCRFQMNTKPTRILSPIPIHSVGLVFKNSLIDFITQFTLPKHSIHPMKFIHRGKWQDNYSYLLFEENMFYHLDFKKSIWEVKDHYKDEWRFQKFNSIDECLEFWELENSRCIGNSLVLKDTAKAFEFFFFRWNSIYYCNEKFRNACIEKNHEDISFKEIVENNIFKLSYD